VDVALAAAQRGVVGRRRAVHSVVHVAAVVREEDDDGLLGELQLFELVEDNADAVVEALDHAAHGRAFLVSSRVRLLAVLRDERVFGLEGGVDGVVPEAEEEGLALVRGEVLAGLGGDAVGDVLALRAIGDGARAESVGREVARRPGIGRAVEADVEALGLRPVLWRHAEMPLADEPCVVACGLEGLGDRDLIGRQEAAAAGGDDLDPRRRFSLHQRLVGHGRQVASGGGDPEAAGVLARHDAGAGGRAEGVGGVGVGEAHAPPCQAVDVGRLVVAAPVDRRVEPSEVVGEDEQDVGAGLRLGPRGCRGCRERGGAEAELPQERPSGLMAHGDLLEGGRALGLRR